MPKTPTSTRIAELNDTFRKTFWGGKVMLTRGISALPDNEKDAILALVRKFDNFTPDNDPYGEHDFGAVNHNGQRIFWKIEYYDPALTFGSENPADPTVTTRVLTIMLAEEY